jgi:hypothetical protein
VDAIRSHLGRAGSADTALFWYSGHGSHQSTARPAGLAPGEQDQTLVLYDSRSPESRDLLDIELGDLITGVARGGAHVLVILDCCHSGSGTRDPFEARATTIRQAPSDPRARLHLPTDPGDVAEAGPRPAGWALGVGRHILLAACQPQQTAKEVTSAFGVRRGALGVALEQVLRSTATMPTYSDLVRLAGPRVRSLASEQSPVLEVTRDADATLPFLGGALRNEPAHYRAYYEGGGWVVEAGALQGLSSRGAYPTTLRLHDPQTDLTRAEAAIAVAPVARVSGDRSWLASTTEELRPGREYWAVLDRLAVPFLRVAVANEDLTHAVAASPLLEVTASHAQAVVDGSGPYTVRDQRRAPGSYPPEWTVLTAAKVVTLLERMARWHHVIALDHPQSRLSVDQLTLSAEVFAPDGSRRVSSGPQLVLPYVADEPQSLTLMVQNQSQRTLFVTVLDAGEDYAIASDQLTPGNIRRLAPGESWSVADGAEIGAIVPDEFWERGVTTRSSVVKVIASTTEFDSLSLTQPGADWETDRSEKADLPLEPVEGFARARSALVVRSHAASDWTTRTLWIIARRPQTAHAVGESPVEVTDGVTVAPHRSFRAKLRLTSLTESERDISGRLLPLALSDDPELSGPFSLTTSRAEDALDVLELSDLVDPGTVTAEEPWLFHTDIAADDHVVVLGWQGDVCLPVGFRNASGDLVIERIPDAVDTRSLKGSVRLLLRKFARRWVGAPEGTVRLAIPHLGDTDQVEYDDDPTAVAAAVGAAKHIAVLVHGIIGDTRGMVLGGLRGDADGPGLADQYDLVLAVDYESIHTTVDDTGRQLLAKLSAAGVSPERPVDLVVHSMGGLVARWMVEVLGGAPLVRRLVMLGTPNNGSPWPRVQDAAWTLLTLGLNRVVPLAWPAVVFSGLLGTIERVDNALDDMTPGSERLRTLRDSPDPGTTYVVIAGNTSLMEGDDRAGVTKVALVLAKRAAWALSLGHENDIAVVVESARALPAGRVPAPDLRVIGCDHLSYFSSSAGLAAVRDAVKDG